MVRVTLATRVRRAGRGEFEMASKQIADGRAVRLLLVSLAGCCVASLSARPAQAQYVGQVSSFVMDAGSGQVLQQYNQDLQRFPASLTKLMTLYLAFQALRDNHIALDQAVPVSAHAASMEPSKLGLVPGTYVTVEQAILALVTKSANDAACALGEMLASGDEHRFGQLMTQQARLLGMSNTTFRNASGLPDPEQVSTARDFAVLARHLIRDFPDQYHYFAVPAFMFHGRTIGNHDPMLRIYPGADGLKTGYTADAGHNLVSSAVRGNVRLIGVLLGARSNPQRAAMMANLLDAGFQQEGVPIMARPAPPHTTGRRAHAMTLVSDDAAPAAAAVAEPVWHGRHHLHRGLRLRAVHLTAATTHVGRGERLLHFAGARLRRVLAHIHRPIRVRLTSAAGAGADQVA